MAAQTRSTDQTQAHWLAHYQSQGYAVRYRSPEDGDICLTRTRNGSTRFVYLHADGSVTD